MKRNILKNALDGMQARKHTFLDIPRHWNNFASSEHISRLLAVQCQIVSEHKATHWDAGCSFLDIRIAFHDVLNHFRQIFHICSTIQSWRLPKKRKGKPFAGEWINNNKRNLFAIDYFQCYTAKTSVVEYNNTSANITGGRYQAFYVLGLRCASETGQK